MRKTGRRAAIGDANGQALVRHGRIVEGNRRMFNIVMETQSSTGTGSVVATLIWLVVLVALLAALWRVFTKAGEPGILGIIPLVNTFYMLKIVGRPFWWFFLFLIPFVGWIFAIIALHDLSRSFGRSGWFTVGLVFLPFIFLPILGFGGARYHGPAAAGPQRMTTTYPRM